MRMAAGKGAFPAGTVSVPPSDFGFVVREGDFFFLVGIGLHRVLRADQREELVRALEIEFLFDAVLRPTAVDGVFRGVERALVNALNHGNLEVKGGFLLADLDGGQSADALVGTVERSDELLLIVVGDVQLEAEAQAFAFKGALPETFNGGNSVKGLSRACAGGLTVKIEGKADVALGPAAADAGVLRCDAAVVGSADRINVELQGEFLLRESGELDAVDTLVEAVNRGFERTVFGFGNV